MKKKKFLTTMLVYVFILTLLPVSFIMSKVKAAEETAKDYTKYNLLKYEILKSAMYEDCSVAYTREGYYIIKNDSEPEFKAYPSTNFYDMGRVGDDLYFHGSDSFASVNLKNGQVSKDVKIPNESQFQVVGGIVDGNAGKWFSLYKYDNKTDKFYYSILRMDSENKSSNLEINNFSMIPSKIQVDSNNNLWFSGYGGIYEIGRVSFSDNKLSSAIYSFKDVTKLIEDYKVDKNGTIWASDYEGDVNELVENSGKLQIKHKYEDTKALLISLDNSMTPWILSIGDKDNGYSGKVSKLADGKFVHRYNVNQDMLECGYGYWGSDLNVIDDNNMLLTCWDMYTVVRSNPAPSNNENNNNQNGNTPNTNGNNDTPNANNNPTVASNDAAKVIEAVKNAADGAKVTVNAQDNTKADKSVFESIKGKNKTLVYEEDNVSWSFSGVDLDGDMKDLDLMVKTAPLTDSTTKDKNDIKNVVKDYIPFVISFAENGKLPLKAGAVVKVKVKVDSKWLAGKDKNNIFVYYYNPTTKGIELIAKQLKIDENGYVEFGITHNSDYFLADKELAAATSTATTTAAATTTTASVLPKTGFMVDMNMLLVVGIAVLCMGAFFTFGRKNEN